MLKISHLLSEASGGGCACVCVCVLVCERECDTERGRTRTAVEIGLYHVFIINLKCFSTLLAQAAIHLSCQSKISHAGYVKFR